MQKIRYRITTLSPVVISSKAGDMNMVNTEKYIPGTSVLGILANRLITKNSLSDAHMDNDFYNWFLAGKLKISNAYIFTKDKNNKEVTHVPVPFSIQNEKNDDKKIYNLLYADDEDIKDIQTKSIDSFCAPNFLYKDIGEDKLQTKSVETSLNFHHARDREKGISKEGDIFNFESIAPNQVFEGEIIGEKTDIEKLIKLCNFEKPCYVGRSKNSQYGKIQFKWVDKEPNPYNIPEIETDDDEISLTFLSDTIIYNKNGFSTADIKELETYLGVKIEKAFIKKGQVETFVNKWLLRKPSETCFEAGSTFLLKGVTKDHLDKFAKLQQTGIGERTHEGFGRCVFGWKTEGKDLSKEDEDKKKKKLEKPKQITKKSTEILEAIARDYIKKQAEQMGLDDQKDFKRLPSNALIGRLSAILKIKKTQEEFKKALDKLKRTAKNQLERCNNGEKTLWDFLMDFNLNLLDLILNKPSNKNLKELCKEIPFEKDEKLENLYQIYFDAFFSMMRKRSKERE